MGPPTRPATAPDGRTATGWAGFALRSVFGNVLAWWPVVLLALALAAARLLMGPPATAVEAAARGFVEAFLLTALAFGLARPDGSVRRAPRLSGPLVAASAALALVGAALAAVQHAAGPLAWFAEVANLLAVLAITAAVGTLPAVADGHRLWPLAATAASFRGLAGRRGRFLGAYALSALALLPTLLIVGLLTDLLPVGTAIPY